jgi:hypothetical protein
MRAEQRKKGVRKWDVRTSAQPPTIAEASLQPQARGEGPAGPTNVQYQDRKSVPDTGECQTPTGQARVETPIAFHALIVTIRLTSAPSSAGGEVR